LFDAELLEFFSQQRQHAARRCDRELVLFSHIGFLLYSAYFKQVTLFMAVTDKQKRYLKGLAHSLKPVVMVGNSGLTESVVAEINNALEHHELIKVRISGQERAERKAMLDEIAQTTGADLILVIGNIGGFYRPAKDPSIQLPR
jgi:RNA-binding protein